MPLVVILVVGQDPVILQTRSSILRSAGYAAREASTIAEAIELFQNGDFDLILLCHSLPLNDRDRIVRFIRSAGSHVPICTVSSASGDFQAGLTDRVLSSRPQDLIKELEATVTVEHLPQSMAHAGYFH
nr:response regulator [Acidicapsa dinghuensis]